MSVAAPLDADEAERIGRDLEAVAALDVLPDLLTLVCDTTGMGFAAIARVTDTRWTAMAVEDRIQFGLRPGGDLDVHTTLCKEVRAARAAVVIDHASAHPVYATHHTPLTYRIESYISVPIVLGDGSYFGNLCAIDPRPAQVSTPAVRSLFALLARLIAMHLQSERRRRLAESTAVDERALGQLREQFIAVLGHDLRNPLAAIDACGQVVQRRATTPELRGIGDRIVASSRRMSGLIADMLDFARGRLGGGFDSRAASVDDLATALAQVVAELQEAHADRDIVAHVDVPGSVWCDRTRLQQLLSNLLANALVHGRPGSPVRVSARLEGRTLEIAVHNHGDPIPAARLERLFEPFSGLRAHGGLGLGLFICHHIVKAHGGRLGVQSTGDGTTFTASLPVDAPAVAGA